MRKVLNNIHLDREAYDKLNLAAGAADTTFGALLSRLILRTPVDEQGRFMLHALPSSGEGVKVTKYIADGSGGLRELDSDPQSD